ncbi:hypothetical protein BGZ79_004124 [Entomortierella chlamydospora]|nr:hypothetical protein BGZ79_004124 [Entomortierella chlamydospora]
MTELHVDAKQPTEEVDTTTDQVLQNKSAGVSFHIDLTNSEEGNTAKETLWRHSSIPTLEGAYLAILQQRHTEALEHIAAINLRLQETIDSTDTSVELTRQHWLERLGSWTSQRDNTADAIRTAMTPQPHYLDPREAADKYSQFLLQLQRGPRHNK